MKKALITGINGFVGPYLKNELERHGYVVAGLGRKKNGLGSEYYSVDVTDNKALSEAVQKAQPQYIFHLAGVSSPAYAESHRDLTFQVNVKGTKNILTAALFNQPKIFIAGSSFVYGKPQYLPIDEKHPLKGKGVYAESRIQQEKLAGDFQNKLSIVMSRSFNHTGPGQPDITVVPKFVKHIIEIKKGLRDCLETGNINVKRDILDVRDVVRAYRLLLEQEKFGIICNVCRGESISLKEILEYSRIMAQLNDIPIRVDANLIRKDEAEEIYGDDSKLKSLINWDARIDYQRMVRDIYDFWNNKA